MEADSNAVCAKNVTHTASDVHLVVVVHGVGDQFANNSFVTSLEKCSTALSRLVERQWQHLEQATPPVRGAAARLPPVAVRWIEWHSKLQYKYGWNHLVERVTPPGIEEVRRVMRETFGDIALFLSPRWHRLILREVAQELELCYRVFIAELRAAGHQPVVHVSLLCHSLGAIVAFDLLRDPAQRQRLSFTVEHVFCCGSPLGAYLSLIDSGEQLAREWLVEPCGRGCGRYGCGDAAKATASGTRRLRCDRPRFHNLMHPLDPAAFRVEPWLDGRFALEESVELPLPRRPQWPARALPSTLNGTAHATFGAIDEHAERRSCAAVARQPQPGYSSSDSERRSPHMSSSSASDAEPETWPAARPPLRRSFSVSRLTCLEREESTADDPFAAAGIGALMKGSVGIGLSRSASNPDFAVPLESDVVADGEARDGGHDSNRWEQVHSRLSLVAERRNERSARHRRRLREARAKAAALAASRASPAAVAPRATAAEVPELPTAALADGDTSAAERAPGERCFRRLDYVVHDPQVARSGRVWQFVQCLRSHACYWTNNEVAAFIVNVVCDSVERPVGVFDPSVTPDVGLVPLGMAGEEDTDGTTLPTTPRSDSDTKTALGAKVALEPADADAWAWSTERNGAVSAGTTPGHPESTAGTARPWGARRRARVSDGADAGRWSASRDSDGSDELGRAARCIVAAELSRASRYRRAFTPPLPRQPPDRGSPFPALRPDGPGGARASTGLLVGDSAPKVLRVFSDWLERLVVQGRWMAALMLVMGAVLVLTVPLTAVLVLVLQRLYLVATWTPR